MYKRKNIPPIPENNLKLINRLRKNKRRHQMRTYRNDGAEDMSKIQRYGMSNAIGHAPQLHNGANEDTCARMYVIEGGKALPSTI